MNGVVNLAYPLFYAIDGMLGALPPFLRLVLWGAVSGASAMWLYTLMSNQERIKAMQSQSRDLRAAVRDTDEAGEAARLALDNLKLAFRTLGTVTGPAVLSGLPVILVLAWLSAAYGTMAPPQGAAVAVTSTPESVPLQVAPPAGDKAIAWPPPDAKITLTDSSGVIYDAPPQNPPAWIVHKRQWWNWLLGNEGGYLPASAAVDQVVFGVPEPEILSVGPSWMRGWAFTYLVSLMIVSLVIKFTFRIA